MPTGTKTVPTVVEHYQRRSLVSWRALAGTLTAEERATQMWALSVLEKDPLASLDTLLARLDDEDASVRLAAIVATGRLAPPSPRVAERLVTFFAASEEPLRRHARLAVGQLGAVAVEPLRGLLGDESVRVRWSAVAALGDIGVDAAGVAEDLAPLALDDANASVRRQARFSLARLGRSGIEACIDLMRKTETTTARAEIATALALAGGAVVAPMATLLQDEDEDIAARAAGVLVDLGPKALPALDALLGALRRAGPVRFNAAEALLRIGPPARKHIEPLAKSSDEGIAGIARYLLDTWDGK
jgi:HEAT repeat protein